MGDSFDCAISHVELRDLAACEDYLPYSVLSGWHQSDRVSGECLGQFEDLALEADAAFVLDAADLMFGRVLDGRQGLGEGTRAGSEPGDFPTDSTCTWRPWMIRPPSTRALSCSKRPLSREIIST